MAIDMVRLFFLEERGGGKGCEETERKKRRSVAQPPKNKTHRKTKTKRQAKRNLTGVMNYTNPGAISHNEILSLYKEYVDEDFAWSNFTVEEVRRRERKTGAFSICFRFGAVFVLFVFVSACARGGGTRSRRDVIDIIRALSGEHATSHAPTHNDNAPNKKHADKKKKKKTASGGDRRPPVQQPARHEAHRGRVPGHPADQGVADQVRVRAGARGEGEGQGGGQGDARALRGRFLFFVHCRLFAVAVVI